MEHRRESVGISHEISRVRHELRRRALTVARIEDLNPEMRRIHFGSPDMDGFPSVGFDDHVKMFIPSTGIPGDGPPAAGPPDEGGKPVMRDFKPRRFDVAGGTMVIDYAMHHAGPAVDWARDAKIGDILQIDGPRGSAVITDDFDWYWLISNESAGDGFIWIVAEAQVARAVRRAVEARCHPNNWLKAAGYWQAGDPGVHIRIED